MDEQIFVSSSKINLFVVLEWCPIETMDHFVPIAGRNVLVCQVIEPNSGVLCAGVVAASRTSIGNHNAVHGLPIPTRGESRDLINAAKARDADGSYYPFAPRTAFPCRPLEGVPIIDALRCSACYVVQSDMSMPSHLSKHRTTSNVLPNTTHVRAQRFGRRLVYVDPTLVENIQRPGHDETMEDANNMENGNGIPLDAAIAAATVENNGELNDEMEIDRVHGPDHLQSLQEKFRNELSYCTNSSDERKHRVREAFRSASTPNESQVSIMRSPWSKMRAICFCHLLLCRALT